MNSLIHEIGEDISIFNRILFFMCVFLIAREAYKAFTSRKKTDIDFHYIMLFICISFGTANYFAYYRFYDAWVKAEVVNIQMELVINGVKDRVCMLSAGIGLLFLSYKYRPSWFMSDDEDLD